MPDEQSPNSSSLGTKPLTDAINALISAQKLPADFSVTVDRYYRPLAESIAARHRQAGRSILVGINGAQGTGKSTLAEFLRLILTLGEGLKCAVLSVDDIYLSKAERQVLAQDIHPLLATRGVPGTHDVKLGLSTIEQLLQPASVQQHTSLPTFSKASDDRLLLEEWRAFNGQADIVLLEGWCVGAIAQAPGALASPVNALEAEQDPDGIWRGYVNQQLTDHYPALFGRFDMLVMLKAPSLECVYEWRCLQEQKLAEKLTQEGKLAQATGLMSPEQLRTFIMHYERLTRWMLEEMPARADYLLTLDHQHRVSKPANHASDSN